MRRGLLILLLSLLLPAVVLIKFTDGRLRAADEAHKAKHAAEDEYGKDKHPEGKDKHEGGEKHDTGDHAAGEGHAAAHEHSPFDHVMDTTEWVIFDQLGLTIHLPPWLSKFKILVLIAAMLAVMI